jgi:hypothetical protein
MTRCIITAAAATFTLLGITACTTTDTSPTAPLTPAVSSANRDGLPDGQPQRSGIVRIVKNCKDYHGAAGETCTITSSNLEEIKAGSTVVYATGADATGFLDTDIVILSRGGSRRLATGHCALDLLTGDGRCTLVGDKERRREFHADVVVSHLQGADYAWTGTYGYGEGKN